MGHKLFSFIHGQKALRIAPGTKVLPQEVFSTLLASEELLKQVKKDAEKYKKEIVSECEQLKERSQKEGFEAGFNAWAAHIAELEQEIKKAHEEISKVVVPLALKAAKKIVGREIELSRQATVDIVANSLKAVAQHKKILIYVNRSDVEILEAKKTELKAIFEQLESLSIREREDIEPGGCVIETEAGIINAQLSNQWQILEKAFAVLMEKPEESKTDA